MNPADQKYCATFKVLAEYVKHHVKEEESEMFPALRKAKLDVDSLGQDMRSRRMQLMDEMGQSGAHRAEADAEDESEEEEEKGRFRARGRTRVPG